MASASKRQQWQSHVDDALLRTGQVQKAAIFGLDGKEWATSSGFEVKTEQANKLAACIVGDYTSLYDGIKVAGESYVFVKCVPDKYIHGRKSTEESGICIMKTRKALIFGTYEGGIQFTNCFSVMEKMTEYLKQHGL